MEQITKRGKRKKVKALGNASNRCFSDQLLNVIGGDILTGRGSSPHIEISSFKAAAKGQKGHEFIPISQKVSEKEMAEVVRVIRKGCATEFESFNALREFVRDELGLKECDVCIAFGEEMLGWFFNHDIYGAYSLKPKEYKMDEEMKQYIANVK